MRMENYWALTSIGAVLVNRDSAFTMIFLSLTSPAPSVKVKSGRSKLHTLTHSTRVVIHTLGWVSSRVEDASLMTGLITELGGTPCADSWPFSLRRWKSSCAFVFSPSVIPGSPSPPPPLPPHHEILLGGRRFFLSLFLSTFSFYISCSLSCPWGSHQQS